MKQDTGQNHMSKTIILSIVTAMAIIGTSCTGNPDFNGEDIFRGNGPGQIPGSNPNQEPPTDSSPSSSGVVIDDEAASEDNVANTKFDGDITITFSETSATIDGSIEGVSIQKNGARVTAINTGDRNIRYILKGKSSDGSFKLYSTKKQAIVLDGLTLTNTKGAAINNQSGKRTFLVICGTNSISDGNVNASGNYPEETAEEDMKAAIFSEGQLAVSGSGKLTVSAVGKAGITSDDYVRFMTGSDVSVTSAKGHGVRGKDAVIVSGGSIDVTLEATATGRKCFTTDSLLYIGGGKTTLVNKASAGTLDSELTGAAGIKADKIFVIQGGDLEITAAGNGCKCISGDMDGYFEGGKVVVTATGANYGKNSTSSKAIKFDGNLEFSGADVAASASSHEAIESKGTLFISGGSVSAVSQDDAINSSSTMTITGGAVYAHSTGNDGIDANGNLVIKGGIVFAAGSSSPEVGIDANTEGGFRLYIQGGSVIAVGGLERNSSVSQPVISTSWTKNTFCSLCDGNEVLFSFKTPSSGGTGLTISSPSLVSGTGYSFRTAATVTGAETYFEGLLSVGGSASGGTSSSVTATDYSSTSSGGGFPGGGPGGGGWGRW